MSGPLPLADRLSTRHVALLASFAALTPIAIDMYLPALPALAAELDVPVSRASLSVSVFFFGVAAGQLVAGPVSDRYGRRPTIAVGLTLFIAAAILAALAKDFRLLIAARVVQAFGACAVTVAGRAIVKDRLDMREAARTFSLLALIGGIAPITAPLLGAAMLFVADWRAIFLVMAAVAVIILCCQLLALPETRSDAAAIQARAEHPLRAYWTLLRDRRVAGYMLAASGNSCCLFAYITNSPTVLMSGYGFSSFAFSVAFGANAVGLLIANQFNRTVLKKTQPPVVLRRSAFTAAVLAGLFALFAATSLGGLPVLLSLLFLGVATTAVVQANVMAGALSIDPLRAGAISALYGATTFAAGLDAAWLAAMLEDGSGRALASGIAAGFALSSAAILLLAMKNPGLGKKEKD